MFTALARVTGEVVYGCSALAAVRSSSHKDDRATSKRLVHGGSRTTTGAVAPLGRATPSMITVTGLVDPSSKSVERSAARNSSP